MRVFVSRGFNTKVSLSLTANGRQFKGLYAYNTSLLYLRSYKTGVWLPKEQREHFVIVSINSTYIAIL